MGLTEKLTLGSVELRFTSREGTLRVVIVLLGLLRKWKRTPDLQFLKLS